MNRYRVKLFYSGYLEKEVEAEDHDHALDKVKDEVTDSDLTDIVLTLERWPEADESELIFLRDA